MPSNVAGAIDVPCSLMGGLDTETAPADLPEGVSPDNNDVVYVPGSVRQRPGAERLYATPFQQDSIVYHKTYIQPNGNPLTLFLASNGQLLQEDVNNSPGTYTDVVPGGPGGVPTSKAAFCKSVSAFGREYMAFSDGQHGLDVPRQYDGSTFYRATQDGPGTLNLTISQQQETRTITSIGPIRTLTIATVTEYQTLVSVTTTTPHGLFVNDEVVVNCIDPVYSNYGNPILVEQVDSPTTFSYTVGLSGLIGVTGGTVYCLKVELTTATPHGLLLGDMFSVLGNSWALYNSATTYATGSPPFPALVNWSLAGKPPAGQTIPATPSPMDQTVTFPADFVGSSGSCGTNPSSAVSFGIAALGATAGFRVIGIAFISNTGVVTFQTGSGIPFVADGLPKTVYPDDTVYFYTPTPQNSTLADVSFTLIGNAVATATTPPQWTVTEVASPTQVYFNAVSSNVVTGTGGTLTVGGQLSGGEHKLVVFLETFYGEQTAPSPPITFSALTGSRVTISNLPSVYANIKSINFAFTLAGGDNYFYIPVVPTGASIYGVTQPIGTATTVTPTVGSVTFDFSDTTLAGAVAIDIPGNNLFDQVKLAPCLGMFAYASRLIAWGEPNVVVNLLNMGFDGGYDPSTGVATGWQTIAGDLPFRFIASQDNYTTGQAYTYGTGTYGMYQGAYQDAYGIAILQPKIKYRIRMRAYAYEPILLGGTLTVNLISKSTSVSLVGGPVVFQISAMTVEDGTDSMWIDAQFPTETPATIVSDAILTMEAVIPAGQLLVLDEAMLIYADVPWRSVARVSYANNPGGFDNVTGLLGTTTDQSPIQCFSTIRDLLRMKTSAGTHRTQDNPGAEPSDWSVAELSRRVGALSFRSADPGQYGSGDTGEEWELIAARGGLYITEGGPFYKISQEIQSIWERINFSVAYSIWLKNDTVARRCYIGVPLDDATAPNVILVMDYRELDTAQNISSASPIHISFTGKMIASDLTRKWTIWTLATNSGELIERPYPTGIQFTIGCGNGVTPGADPSFGNIYQFNTLQYKDEDYGHIPASYTTYFFVNHEAEIALQLGGHRKLFYFLSAFITGSGNIVITPKAAALTNPWPQLPPYPLSPTQNFDLEWGVNVLTERCAFTFQVAAPNPMIDTWFNLEKMVVALKPDPFSPVRGLA